MAYSFAYVQAHKQQAKKKRSAHWCLPLPYSCGEKGGSVCRYCNMAFFHSSRFSFWTYRGCTHPARLWTSIRGGQKHIKKWHSYQMVIDDNWSSFYQWAMIDAQINFRASFRRSVKSANHIKLLAQVFFVAYLFERLFTSCTYREIRSGTHCWPPRHGRGRRGIGGRRGGGVPDQ